MVRNLSYVRIIIFRSKEYMDKTPVAVAHSKSAGSSEISSCNYAARAFGVSSGTLLLLLFLFYYGINI